MFCEMRGIRHAKKGWWGGKLVERKRVWVCRGCELTCTHLSVAIPATTIGSLLPSNIFHLIATYTIPSLVSNFYCVFSSANYSTVPSGNTLDVFRFLDSAYVQIDSCFSVWFFSRMQGYILLSRLCNCTWTNTLSGPQLNSNAFVSPCNVHPSFCFSSYTEQIKHSCWDM
jgi:hypothetical protein